MGLLLFVLASILVQPAMPASASASMLPGLVVDRIAGTDRYATATAISQLSHPTGAAVAYLAIGTDFPDACAAGPAAAVEGAPILLTRAADLPDVTSRELKRLRPGLVVILGGPAAIGQAVVEEIRVALPTATVERRWGPDRYATAVAVSRAVFGGGVASVFVVTGRGFSDAAVAAAAAAAEHAPLLLTPSARLPDSVRAEIIRLAPARIVIAGGSIAVSEAVAAELAPIAPVTRIDGRNRYDLSARVSEFVHPGGSDTAYLAVGDRFPDALAIGPFAAADSAPVLLVGPDAVSPEVGLELDRLGVERIVVVGGPAAVSDRVLQWLVAGDLAGGLAPAEMIYLTFDDGPDPARTRVILEILERYGVRATFFVTGRKVDAHPEIAREILARGHSLQTHAYDHYYMHWWTTSAVLGEILAGMDAIEDATGTRPTCFRPPGGSMSVAIRAAAARAGVEIVMWDVDSGDSQHQTSSGILASARRWRTGDVILGHDTLAYLWDDDILAQIIRNQHAAGRTFGTICDNV